MGWGFGAGRPAGRRAPASRGVERAGKAGEGGEDGQADAPSASSRKPARPGLSLKGRALKLLSQREHSRLELGRKLVPHAESADQIEPLLDALERDGFLSSERFARSLAHRRAPRFGLRRIEQELGAHRLDPAVAGPVLQGLRDTERDRALVAWRKRFGESVVDLAERARHHRFLAQRGFTGDAIHWVLRHAAAPPDDEPSSDEPSSDEPSSDVPSDAPFESC
jgi:regulatory protein